MESSIISKPGVSYNLLPPCVSSFASKDRYEKVSAFVSKSLTTLSSEREIDEIVSKIRDDNKLNFFPRIIDRFFNHSQKQHARDQMVTLTIAGVYKQHVNNLTTMLKQGGGDQLLINQKLSVLSLAVARSIGKMDYVQLDNTIYSTVEECAAHALHCLQQGTNAGCAIEFQNIWTLTNIKIDFVDDEKEKIYLTAIVSLSEENGGPLSFDITVSDINQNDFALRYIALNAEDQLKDKREHYSVAVCEYEDAVKIYKEQNDILTIQEKVLDDLKDRVTGRSVQITEKTSLILRGNKDVSCEEFNDEIQQLIEEAEMLTVKEDQVVALRKKCLTTSLQAKKHADEMHQRSDIYNKSAQAFNRIGQFIQESLTVSDASEGLKQTLNTVLKESRASSPVAFYARQQRPALKTHLFHQNSYNHLGYIEAEYDRHNNIMTPEVRKSLEDIRGNYIEYAKGIKDAFQTWQNENYSYREHESTLSKKVKEYEGLLTEVAKIKNEVIGKYENMTTSFIDLSNGRPDLDLLSVQEEELVHDFVLAFESSKHNVAKTQVNETKEYLKTLLNNADYAFEKFKKSQEKLTTMAAPYYGVVRLNVGESDSTSTTEIMINRCIIANDNLKSIIPAKLERTGVISVQEAIKKFESDEKIITTEYKTINPADAKNRTAESIKSSINSYVSDVKKRRQERVQYGLHQAMYTSVINNIAMDVSVYKSPERTPPRLEENEGIEDWDLINADG